MSEFFGGYNVAYGGRLASAIFGIPQACNICLAQKQLGFARPWDIAVVECRGRAEENGLGSSSLDVVGPS